ncbi:hypothetical protein NQ318_009955 [Aromia moschata]|uniref:ATP-dependent RNA helicase DHX37-like C-terminal domain-containing protein n=1 Tax=Aromia moschata TaxID=1265417 RepID=A0AAV8YHU5_9CUCU|nr:hypothetical protein NQ318_009955 [Aromia moschata]
MRGVTAIEPEWLATYVPNLCNLSEPLLTPEPRYNPASDLLAEYLKWLPESAHGEISLLWPPLDKKNS